MEYKKVIDALKSGMKADSNTVIQKGCIKKLSFVDKTKYSSVALNQAKDNGKLEQNFR